jgi:hypothetical protein
MIVMNLKRVMLLLGSLVISMACMAQGAFTVDAPRVVELDESFRLVFTANSEPTSFNPPVFSGFDVLAGPSASTMSSTQIINGKRTESFQVSYTYVLQPKSVGKFTIPSASVVIGGKGYTSNPITIEVVKGDGSAAGNSERSAQATGSVSSDDIFMRMSISKGRVVKGESLVATLKIYTKVPIAGFENVKFPTFNGFWSQEIETPSNIEFVRESVNGKIYDAAVLRRYMLVPQQTGSLTIEPSEMICLIQIKSPTGGGQRSVFDDFFESYQTVKKRITAPGIHIMVDALPAGAPATFAGGVGDFQMSAKLTRDTVSANEAVSLIVTISGTGNINLIDAPKIEFPADFEVYDVKISDKSNKTNKGASGIKEFEFPIIPRGSGHFVLGPVKFSYYDISSKNYITLSSGDLTLKVGKDKGGNSGMSSSLSLGVNKQAVKSLTNDIRYIHTGLSHLKRGNQFFVASFTFYALLVLMISLYFVTNRFLSKRIERNRDIAGVKNRRANKVARARLKTAESFLKQKLYTGFYEELHRAILGYCSDKLALPLSDLSREKIAESLTKKSVKPDLIQELLSLIEACEYARYAPDPGGVEMDKNYSRAIRLISDLEV